MERKRFKIRKYFLQIFSFPSGSSTSTPAGLPKKITSWVIIMSASWSVAGPVAAEEAEDKLANVYLTLNYAVEGICLEAVSLSQY